MHFFGEVPRAEALGLNREDRPAAFAGRSESIRLGRDTALAYTNEYPIPSVKRSINLRSVEAGTELDKLGVVPVGTSGATSGTRYIFPPWLPVAGKCADSMIAKLPPPPVQHVRVYFTRPRHLGDTRAQFQSPYGGLFELLGE